MKTAVSIPDNLFNDAEITARQMGLGRSQLYVLAIREFIEHHSRERIREKLDEVYSHEIPPKDFLEIGLDQLRNATEHDTW